MFPMQMLAAGGIGGIEILIGATALLSVVAIIAFFVGDSRESSASEGTTSVAEAVVEAAIEGDPEAEIDAPSETETDPAAEPVMAKLVDDEPKGKPTSVLSDLPKLDASKGKPKPSVLPVLPSLPVISANVDDADPLTKKMDEPKELPVFPMPPVPKPTASDLPKPFLDDRPESGDSALVPELPTKPEKEKKKPTLPAIPIPPADMPALPPLPAKARSEIDPPPLPKRGSDLPPLPDIPTLEDEADLQTREQERDV